MTFDYEIRVGDLVRITQSYFRHMLKMPQEYAGNLGIVIGVNLEDHGKERAVLLESGLVREFSLRSVKLESM